MQNFWAGAIGAKKEAMGGKLNSARRLKSLCEATFFKIRN